MAKKNPVEEKRQEVLKMSSHHCGPLSCPLTKCVKAMLLRGLSTSSRTKKGGGTFTVAGDRMLQVWFNTQHDRN